MPRVTLANQNCPVVPHDHAGLAADPADGWAAEELEMSWPQASWVMRVSLPYNSRASNGNIAGEYLPANGRTTTSRLVYVRPGDIIAVHTHSIMRLFVMLPYGHCAEITDSTINDESTIHVRTVLAEWSELPRTSRIFRGCYENKTLLDNAAATCEDQSQKNMFFKSSAVFEQIIADICAKTEAPTMTYIKTRVASLVAECVKVTTATTPEIYNMVLTAAVERASRACRTTAEVQVVGLDELVYAIHLVFSSRVPKQRHINMLGRALNVVNENARKLTGWVKANGLNNAEQWNKVPQMTTRQRQLTRFNLRDRTDDNADRSSVQEDDHGQAGQRD